MKSRKKEWISSALAVLSVGLWAEDSSVLPRETQMTAKDQQSFTSRKNKTGHDFPQPCYNEGGTLEFDFLWWRAENQGFASAFHQTNPFTSIGSYSYSSSMSLLQPKSVWKPGFRLGLGWNTDYDQWTFLIDWTWYKNHSRLQATDSVGRDFDGQGFYPVSSGIGAFYGLFRSTGPYHSLSSSWKLWHNALDLELKKILYANKYFSLRTHCGVRGAILKQNFDTNFFSPTDFGIYYGTADRETLRLRNKFWGIGPRICLDTNWLLGKGFSLIWKGAFATLFGQMKWHSLDLVVPPGSSVAVTGAKSGGMSQTLVPNVQLFLGLDWSHYFRNDRILFGLQAGWEINYWWNQNAIVTMGNNMATRDPVTMEGLTVNAHLDF